MAQNYTLILADGKQIKGLSKNGDNFISKKEIDESIFEGNLATMLVSDGETETEYKNVVLVQQVEYADGWYLCFRELSKQELRDMALDSKIEYLAMAADVDLEDE